MLSSLHLYPSLTLFVQSTNIALLVVTGGAVALGFYTQETTPGGVWVAFALAGVCAMLFLMCLLGLIGALRLSRQMLRLVSGGGRQQGACRGTVRGGVVVVCSHCVHGQRWRGCVPSSCRRASAVLHVHGAGWRRHATLCRLLTHCHLPSAKLRVVALGRAIGTWSPAPQRVPAIAVGVFPVPAPDAAALPGAFVWRFTAQAKTSLSTALTAAKRDLILCSVASFIVLALIMGVLSNLKRLVSHIAAYGILLQVWPHVCVLDILKHNSNVAASGVSWLLSPTTVALARRLALASLC